MPSDFVFWPDAPPLGSFGGTQTTRVSCRGVTTPVQRTQYAISHWVYVNYDDSIKEVWTMRLLKEPA